MASSADFHLSNAESEALTDLFRNPSRAVQEGINVGNAKYLLVNADESSIHGKKGSSGVIAVKSAQCVIVAVYGEGQHFGSAATVVERLADYLRGKGY